MSEVQRIAVIGNGPSSEQPRVRNWQGTNRVFRVNHWYLNGGGMFGRPCTDWFIGEHPEIVHTAAAFGFDRRKKPTLWMPGLSGDAITRNQEVLKGYHIRIQKHYQNLPALCRWDKDPRPRRPLTGSLALAVAVGMQPNELFVCGMDLYQHQKGRTATAMLPPDSTDMFEQQYLTNSHGNHALLADLRYIRCALEAFKGRLVCVGSVMKRYFADDFTKWEWIDG